MFILTLTLTDATLAQEREFAQLFPGMGLIATKTQQIEFCAGTAWQDMFHIAENDQQSGRYESVQLEYIN